MDRLTELEEETDNVADDKADLSAGGEHRATRDLVEVIVVTLNQRALGEHEVERESSQAEREEEAQPDEERVGLDHATVSNHRADESAGGIAPWLDAQSQNKVQGGG